MNDRHEIRKIDDWVISQWLPELVGPYPVLLLLHGLTGDENSMSIFVNRLPKDYLLISPRGIFPAPDGGYSWQRNHEKEWPDARDFLVSVEALFGLLTPDNFPDARLDQVNLMGFSQGAALAYVMAMAKPSRINKVVGVSGFMPGQIDSFIDTRPLNDKRIFVAHGKLDELVPIEKAQQVVQVLRQAGAKVNYCEEDVGHKLSANCFRGIKHFFRDE